MASPTDLPSSLEDEAVLGDPEHQARLFSLIVRWMVLWSGIFAAMYLVAYWLVPDQTIPPILLICLGFCLGASVIHRCVKRLTRAIYLVSYLLIVTLVGTHSFVAGIGPLIIGATLLIPMLSIGLFLGARRMPAMVALSSVAALAIAWVDRYATWARFDLAARPTLAGIIHIAVGGTIVVLVILVVQNMDRSSREARETARQLRLLYDTSRLFASIDDLGELLKAVSSALVRILNASTCFVFLRNPANGEPVPLAASGSEANLDRDFHLQPDEPSLSRLVMQRCETIVIEDVSQSPLISPRVLAFVSARSLVGLPLLHRDRIFGAIILGDTQRLRRFTQAEIARVQSLVQQVAMEIANAEVLERERRQAAHLAIRNRVSAVVATSLDPVEVCRLVVEELSRSAGYELVSLYLLKGPILRLQAMVGYDAHVDAIPVLKGVMGRVVRTGQPTLLIDVQHDPDYIAAMPDVLSEACAPLRLGDETLGALNVETRSPRVLDHNDLDLIVAVAAHVVVTLRNARLFADVQQRSREMQALHQIEQAITELDLDRCLQVVAVSARSLVGANLGHVFLSEPGGLRLRAASGPFENQVGRWFLPSGHGLVGWAAEHRTVVNAPNVEADLRYHHTIAATRSEIAIPLIADDEVIGVLDVQSDQLEAFDEHRATLLSMLGAEAAIAIHNAHLFEAERRSRQVTETLLEVAGALGSTLDLDKLLRRMLDELRSLLPSSSASIALLDDEGHRYVLCGSSRQSEVSLSEPKVFDAERMPLARILLSTRRPCRIADTRSSDQWLPLEGADSSRSWLGVPLLHEERVIGFLMLNHGQPGFFSEAHERLAEAFARHATIAIENARLLDQACRHAEREHLVRGINSRISASIDVRTVMQTAVDELGRALGVSRCLIRLGADVVAMPVAFEFHQPNVSPLGVGLKQRSPVVEAAVRERRTAIDAQPDLLNSVLALSSLAAPIIVRSRLIGVISLHQCDRARRWVSDDVELVEAVSAQLGIAVDKARLYEEVTQNLRDLGLLHGIAIQVASAGSAIEAMTRIVDSVHAAIEHARVALLFLDTDTSDLVLTAQAGYAVNAAPIRIQADQGVTGCVAGSGRPALVPDTQYDPRYLDSLGQPARSELAVPLIADSEVVGVLNLESDRVDAFTETDMQLLTTLGGNLAMIVRNLRLLDEVRAANARLQELDRLKSQFLANMSHELRTPLNSIIGFGEVLIDGLAGPLNDEQSEFVAGIHASGKHLLSLINDVLDLSKLQAGKMLLRCQPVRPEEVADDALAVVASLIAQKGQRLVLEMEAGLPLIHADPIRLKQVLINLLSNANKFSPTDSRIGLAAARETDGVRFTVTDEGDGVKPADHQRIFQEFIQVSEGLTRGQGGTGLGLPIARRLVEMHRGRIWVESAGAPGRGAAFHFTIPASSSHASIVQDPPRAAAWEPLATLMTEVVA